MAAKGKRTEVAYLLKKARQVLLLFLLFSLCKPLQAQQAPMYSSAQIDALLQSKNRYCTFPLGMPNFYDSLYKGKTLFPKDHKYDEGSQHNYWYELIFKDLDFSCEGPFTSTCGVESHSYYYGLYYLNGDGTITIQVRWSECRGMLCDSDNKREEMQVSSCRYRIFVLDDRLVFRLIE